MKLNTICKHISKFLSFPRRHLHYTQGQTSKAGIREYFYYIDHRGQLFLDDARMKNFTSCFKDKQFLKLFFTQLKVNTSIYQHEFPFLSPCGPELNFVRSDDLPIVFNKILTNEEWIKVNADKKLPPCADHLLVYAGDQLSTAFLPSELLIDPCTGRVYHPAPAKSGGLGLVGSLLAEQLSGNFVFETENKSIVDELNRKTPTHVLWKGSKIPLKNNHLILEKIGKLQGSRSHAL